MIDRVARASIDIQAPIDTVWAIMIELRRYHEWNPFIIAVRDAPDQMKVGARFRLRVKWANGGQADSWETVTHLTLPTTADRGPASAVLTYRYSSWLARLGLVRATREQHLTQVVGQPTRYRTQETFSGPLAGFLPLADVEEGFQRHATALKTRAER